MRPLEILLLVFVFVALVEPVIPMPRKPRWLAFLPAASLLIAILQFIVEGYRWQMAPVYVLALLVFLLGLRRLRRPASASSMRRPRRIAMAAACLVGVVLVALPGILFPVVVLPVPTGPYKVGTVTYDWVDPARNEIYGRVNRDGKRELMVQIWYPALPAPGARPAPWMDRLDVAAPAFANYIHLPAFMLSHLGLTGTNSYSDAPVSTQAVRYPIVIYSHGWNGWRTIVTNQMEALASHGYIAVALDHTYGAMVTVFPDGRIALNNPAAMPNDVPADANQRASELLEATFAADIRFVMDRLRDLNSTGETDLRFAGRLDLDRIGVYGHSTGGGATVLACSLDPRCKAGLGMDAWVTPIPARVVPGPLAQPFLFMRSEVWATGANNARLEELFTGLQNGGYRMTIRGTQHYDFTLLPLLTPLAPYLKLKGPLDGQRTLQIETDYLLAFFDKHLKGLATPLLDAASPAYPEVTFEKR